MSADQERNSFYLDNRAVEQNEYAYQNINKNVTHPFYK